MKHVRYDESGAEYRFYTGGGLDDETDRYIGEYSGTHPGQRGLGETIKAYVAEYGCSLATAANVVCGEELDRLAKRLMAQTSLSYAEALSRVLNDPNNADLKAAYGGQIAWA